MSINEQFCNIRKVKAIIKKAEKLVTDELSTLDISLPVFHFLPDEK